jgi:hypothetical protein
MLAESTASIRRPEVVDVRYCVAFRADQRRGRPTPGQYPVLRCRPFVHFQDRGFAHGTEACDVPAGTPNTRRFGWPFANKPPFLRTKPQMRLKTDAGPLTRGHLRTDAGATCTFLAL